MNKVLKKGQLVRLIEETQETKGLVKGSLYEVKHVNIKGESTLYVASQNNTYVLAVNGGLTELADLFAIHKCPIVLPMGNAPLGRGVD